MPVVDCLASLAFLLSNGGYQQRMDAILALQGLVYDDKDYQSVAVEEGAIPPLVALLPATAIPQQSGRAAMLLDDLAGYAPRYDLSTPGF